MSFVSHFCVNVTSKVSFVSVFHWCFDDTPCSGCFDVVWWIVSFLLHGGLCLRLWRASRILGALAFQLSLIHFLLFFPKQLSQWVEWRRYRELAWCGLGLWNIAFQLRRPPRCMIIDRPLWRLSRLTIGPSFLHEHDCSTLFQPRWFTRSVFALLVLHLFHPWVSRVVVDNATVPSTSMLKISQPSI